MEDLRAYLNSLPLTEQVAFAARCGTTIGYMRKAIAAGNIFGARLAIAIERETCGAVRVELLDPRADWALLRASA